MVGWHHRLDGHESEETLGVGDGQGGLTCCSPWGRKELGMTEQLSTYRNTTLYIQFCANVLLFALLYNLLLKLIMCIGNSIMEVHKDLLYFFKFLQNIAYFLLI